MNPLTRALTTARVRLLEPLVRARGALRRMLEPPRTAIRDARLDTSPVLVLGCYRSGTSLLRRCLNSHSRIACPPETMFLASFAEALGRRDAARGLAAIDMTLDEATDDLRVLADRWMRRNAAAQDKPRWADRSPGVLLHLDGLDRLVGEQAQYVAIVRDGMDVAASLGTARPRWWELDPFVAADGDELLAAARFWVDRSQRLRAFTSARPDRVHTLRYEDLVRQPERTLRRMFRF
ncbi:MAG: sulfotransferase, partial [Myxococcota bacterium]